MEKDYCKPSVLVVCFDKEDLICTSSLTSGEGIQPNKAEARGRNSIWDE